MAERFYFDIETGGELIRDHRGARARDLEQALADARSIVEEMADQLGSHGLDSDSSIIVRNERGFSVARLALSEVQYRLSIQAL